MAVTNRDRAGKAYDVPEPVARRRFAAGLRNLRTIYQSIAGRWQVYDNSDLHGPRLIASSGTGYPPEVLDPDAGMVLMEHAR